MSEAQITQAELDRMLNRPNRPKTVRLRTGYLPGMDLSGAKLVGMDFELADLTGADFTGATLEHTTFEGANVSGADFTGADKRYAARYGAIGTETAIEFYDPDPFAAR